ncbi:DUF4240 domain-containing protein [Micromonospora sp. NPDC002296]|uniref:DUF4240 domain-containing protein n=1 Tax=Micromonospora sp. NPDC002296 TaxID=3154271 RepID=UPI00332D825A
MLPHPRPVRRSPLAVEQAGDVVPPRDDAAVDTEGFWALVEASARACGGPDERLTWLTDRLAGLPATEVVDFQLRLDEVHDRADTTLDYVAAEAHERITGVAEGLEDAVLPRDDEPGDDPPDTGDEPEESDTPAEFARRYPRLAAMFPPVPARR